MDTEIEMETPDDSIKTDIEIEMETPDDSLLTRSRIALGPPIFDDADSESVDAYSSDDFRMFEFKVRTCARGRSHDWTECPYAHPGEKARRRDPRKYHYSGTACPDFRNGNCKKGDACEFAHGVFECWLHPARYRTQPCKDGPSCSRRVCFFAHTPDQLRVLPQQSPDSYDGSPLRHGTESSCAKTLPFVSSPGQCLQIPSWKIWSRPLRSSLNWIISIPGSIRNVFHPSSEDLADTPLEEVLSWKSFLCFALGSVLNVPPIYAECLIFLFICSLSYQANNLTSPFDIQFGTQSGKSTDTRQSLRRFKEAFHEFFPEMAHIMKFMTCYILTLMLIWPVRPGVQILCIVVLIFAPVFYFPELARKASGVDVACGSFKLPLIWFTSLGALGLSLVCGFLILLVVYISWRFIHKGRPGVEGIQDEVVDSPETSVAIDMEASAVM